MRTKALILFLIVLASDCSIFPEKEEPPPENPYRRALLEKLRQKIECEECHPTKEELIQYYLLKNESDFQSGRATMSNSNPWQNYFNTYFLYFPRNLRNPWYTPGSGSSNGGRAPGIYYYPPYSAYGNRSYGNYGHGRGRR